MRYQKVTWTHVRRLRRILRISEFSKSFLNLAHVCLSLSGKVSEARGGAPRCRAAEASAEAVAEAKAEAEAEAEAVAEAEAEAEAEADAARSAQHAARSTQRAARR